MTSFFIDDTPHYTFEESATGIYLSADTTAKILGDLQKCFGCHVL